METLSKPKAGSRRKVHQDETAPKPAAIGDNNPPLDQEGFLVWAGKIKGEKAIVMKAKKRYDKIRKLAKNAGVELAIMDRVLKEEGQDPDIIIRAMKTYKQYSEWSMNGIGEQISMFDLPGGTMLSFEEREKKARRAGYTRGLMGENPDAEAYPVDNEHHQAHMAGWSDAQAILLARIKPIDTAMDSEGKAEEPAEETESELEEA